MHVKTPLTLALALATGCLSLAPSRPTQAQAAPAAAQDTSATQPQQGGGQDEGSDESTRPLYKVTSVELMRSTHSPELDIVRVRGLSSTDNWSDPQLVAISRGPSADGMLDLMFVARAPDDASAPSKFGPMEAIFVIEPGHPYKGVRVRGATNTVKLTQLPGYAEASGKDTDCSACVGKTYVGKGGSSGGKDAVRDEDLPPGTRVVRENEGIRKLDTDPNRLTLILGPGDRIVQAFWD
jgi:hypothetical protein